MGELLTLLKYLDPKEAEFLAEGEEEVKEMLEELNIQSAPTPIAPIGGLLGYWGTGIGGRSFFSLDYVVM